MGGRATTSGVTLAPKNVREAKDFRPIIATWDKGFILGEVAKSLRRVFKLCH
jgi:hypothetical protein